MPMPRKPRPLCANCQKPVPRPEQKYCNNQCQRDAQYKAWIADWLKGMNDGLRGGIRSIVQYSKVFEGDKRRTV
jgi:predicted amidophosphoribosyltransferase